MYKSKLQELCQQRIWGMPVYSTAKDGPDHDLRFTATVTVDGVKFSTTDLSRNSKDAQNKAAKLAFEHLSTVSLPVSAPNLSSTPKSPSDSSVGPCLREPASLVNGTPLGVKHEMKLIDAHHLYKSWLQNYAIKRKLTLPQYSCEREGPPHACRFKCNVTIDGKSFGSPELYYTVKEAEQAAAKIACDSLVLDKVEQDDSALYKNLLLEVVQKRACQRPKYETTFSGPPHMLVFVSTVSIQGHIFEGQAAKSKRQAEAYAAKVAYFGLQHQPLNKDVVSTVCCGHPIDRQPVFMTGSQIKEALEASSFALQSIIAKGLSQGVSIPAVKSENATAGTHQA